MRWFRWFRKDIELSDVHKYTHNKNIQTPNLDSNRFDSPAFKMREIANKKQKEIQAAQIEESKKRLKYSISKILADIEEKANQGIYYIDFDVCTMEEHDVDILVNIMRRYHFRANKYKEPSPYIRINWTGIV